MTTVVFTPPSEGPKSGTLDTTGPDVALSGIGVALPTPTAPPAGKKKCKKKRGAAAARKKKCRKKRK